jgi:hypothetical protein
MSFPCFPGPVPPEVDDEFDLFAAARPEDIYNPWPQIVDLDAPGYAWSQPFSRVVYIPTTRPDRLLQDRLQGCLHPIYNVAVTHEGPIHLGMDSPAKEWARIHLTWTYDYLAGLLGGEMANWPFFVKNNNLFRKACERMRLAEELLATSVSFNIGLSFATKAEKEVLQDWERSCVTAQNKLLPGFARLYYGGFRKAAELIAPVLNEGSLGWTVLEHLAIFLESVDAQHDPPEVITDP